ncbi:hypothetical protein HK102_003315 [Quaeritorhiza haematococci]|nr:hypothetical protein HK102_003315 [Quaeritorhiza haematococci]
MTGDRRMWNGVAPSPLPGGVLGDDEGEMRGQAGLERDGREFVGKEVERPQDVFGRGLENEPDSEEQGEQQEASDGNPTSSPLVEMLEKPTPSGSSSSAQATKLQIGTTDKEDGVALKLDEFGFFLGLDGRHSRAPSPARTAPGESHADALIVGGKQSKFKSFRRKKEKSVRDLEAQWIFILDNWDVQKAKRRKVYIDQPPSSAIIYALNLMLKNLCRVGIPHSLRAKAWMHMADSQHHDRRKQEPGLFQRLRDVAMERTEQQHRAEEETVAGSTGAAGTGNSAESGRTDGSEIFDVIERDIHRCYPNHILFKEHGGDGQKNLESVLKAYAMYNPGVGYCQGMGLLVGMMLMHMNAEESFWLLVATIDQYVQGYFNPTLSQIRIDVAVFDALLKSRCKKLARHLDSNEVTPLMYITQWFMTFFTTVLPWKSVLRVWDVFYCEDYIITACPSTADILTFLLHIPHEYLQPDAIIEAALDVRLRAKDIEKLRKKVEEAGLPERGTVKKL